MSSLNNENFNCQFNAFNSGDKMIFGNAFLQHFYTVLDIDYGRIGFGPLANSIDQYKNTDANTSTPSDSFTPDQPSA